MNISTKQKNKMKIDFNFDAEQFIVGLDNIVPFTNADQAKGKLFEVSACADIQNDSEYACNSSCAIINIPRFEQQAKIDRLHRRSAGQIDVTKEKQLP